MKNKFLITIGGLALLGGAVWFWYKSRKGYTETKPNLLEELNKNLSEKNLIVDNKIKIMFANKKYTAIFYDNGRLSIFQTGGTVPKFKGSYIDGGKEFRMDDGKVISTGSVWNNLTNVIK